MPEWFFVDVYYALSLEQLAATRFDNDTPIEIKGPVLDRIAYFERLIDYHSEPLKEFYEAHRDNKALLTDVMIAFSHVAEWKYMYKLTPREELTALAKAVKGLTIAAEVLSEAPNLRGSLQDYWEIMLRKAIHNSFGPGITQSGKVLLNTATKLSFPRTQHLSELEELGLIKRNSTMHSGELELIWTLLEDFGRGKW